MQENSSDHRDVLASEPLSQLGLDPSQPLYDLNLAGAQGVPSPQMLSGQTPQTGVILPDFGTQDYGIPVLKAYDLTGPGINHMPEFAPDPALPDLTAYNHPYAVDLYTQGMSPDPQLARDIPSAEEVASSLYPGLGFPSLDVRNGVAAVDPPVPDLQYPDLTQQVQMPPSERPGSLDPSALDVMHATPSYQQVSDKSYPSAWMDQRGMNTTRARHFSLLDDGLTS